MSQYLKCNIWPLALLISTIFIGGCLSEIDIDIPSETGNNIVIVSKLSMGDPSIIEARITGLTPFSEDEDVESIENALVNLVDENGNAQLVPHTLSGNYKSIISQVRIEAGQRYQLRVEVNGNTYESEFEKLHAVPKAIKIEHTDIVRSELNAAGNIVDNRYIKFFIDTPLTTEASDEKVYLKWDFIGNYRFAETVLDSPFPPLTKTCYITRLLNLDKIAIYNGPESRESILEKEFLLEEALDDRFSRGFYLTALQQTLSENAYEYWEQINAITDLSGNFFEDPPGKIIGNFKNAVNPNEEVFGFFYATQTDTVRSFVSAKDYEVPSLCPGTGTPSDESIKSSCFNCLLEVNSTTTKPSYWIE